MQRSPRSADATVRAPRRSPRSTTCTLTYLSGFGLKNPNMWRLDRTRANGALGDVGPHMLDLARWWIGEISSVQAQLAVNIKRMDKQFQPANDAATLLVKFANGTQGLVQVSLSAQSGAHWAQQSFIAHGEAGTLEADFSDPANVQIWKHDQQSSQRIEIPHSVWGGVDPQHPLEVFEKQSAGCRAFVDAILNDTPLSPNFHDGVQVQAVIDAALESDRTGCAAALS
ncbi:MAG: hypothetical protein LC737_04755 [Chloroflexi bacterium]|nr:hypothetical protein [Chloroflexota bacterium]